MHGRWRFRIVGQDLRASYLQSGSAPVELVGGDEQAVILARGLLGDGILPVEAVSVGCPKGITPPRNRKLLTVRLSDDNTGWVLEGIIKPGSWHATVLEAAEHGAIKSAGYETETRILGVKGQTTHVVLVPAQVSQPSR